MKNLMDVLILAQDSGGMYVYNKNYKRIGEKVVDSYDLFKESDNEIITNINNLTVTEDKLNISLVSKIDGTVKINPIQAKKVGLTEEIASIKFRTHAIIKNGKANTDKLVLLINKDALDNFREYKDNIEVVNAMEVFNDVIYVRIAINTENLPVVGNDTTSTSKLLELTIKRDDLLAKTKVIKHYLDQIEYMRDPAEVFMGGQFTIEQVELLKDHGINQKGEYVGVGLKAERDETNFYIAKNIEFQIKGQASVPSVNAVLKKKNEGKKLNDIETVIDNYLAEFKGINPKELEQLQYVGKNELSTVKLKLAVVRMSRVLNNIEQFEGTDLDNKGNLIYTEGGNTLVIKISNEKIYN